MTIEATIPQMFKARVEANPETAVQAFKNDSGAFRTRTYRELYEDTLDLAFALKELGVSRGDLVGLISDNRREWLIADLAVQFLGCADVPRGCDSMEKEIAFILSTTECRLSFVENRHQLTKILNSKGSIPSLTRAIIFNEPNEEDFANASARGVELLGFWDLASKGAAARAGDATTIEAEIERGEGADLATVIFTSGTTGEPKGVMLTHANYTWQVARIPQILHVERGDMWLTILPVWHSFERIMQYIILERGSGMPYSRPVASVMLPDLAKIKPQILPGVPRLWEALASGILRSIKKDGGAKKALFAFFVAVGKRYCAFRDLTFGRVARFKSRVRALDFLLGVIPWLLLFPLHALGDALIFRKIRDKLGGRIRVAISGGGALQPEMDDFYRAVGLNLLEGYGITETTPVLSFRDQIKPRSGCVGKVFPDTECKIVEPEALAKAIEDARGMAAGARDESDGREGLGERAEPDVLGRGVRGAWRSPEGLPTGNAGVIMVRGGQVMAGYYKRPDLTARVIDSDGWFNTGDLGMLSRDNEIKITGRAKDTIVLLGGENVEPAPIERAIKGFECVESAVVLGQDKKYLTALIVPARDALLSYAAENDIPTDDYEALLAHPAIVQLFRAAIDSRVSHHAGFRPFEFIFRFALLSEPFQVGRELSGKQEIMRHRINEIYKARIDTLFRD